MIQSLSSSEPVIRMHVAWVLGTAIQNNEKAQGDFLEAGGLVPVIGLLETDADLQVRNKALYCISGQFFF